MDKYWDKVTEHTEIEWLCRHKLLSKRASNILIRGAIYRGGGKREYKPITTVKELLEIDECDLKLYKNMGAKTLEEVEVFKQKFLAKKKSAKNAQRYTITEQGQVDWLDGYKVGYKDAIIAMQIQLKEKIDNVVNDLLGVEYGIQKIDRKS